MELDLPHRRRHENRDEFQNLEIYQDDSGQGFGEMFDNFPDFNSFEI